MRIAPRSWRQFLDSLVYLVRPHYASRRARRARQRRMVAFRVSRTESLEPRLVLSGDPPIADADSYGVDEDQVLYVSTSGVLYNDTDPEWDSLTATIDEAPDNGSLTFYSDGTFVYTPDPDFYGMDSFTYYAFDGTSNSVYPATVTITVSDVAEPPQPPTAEDDGYETNEDTLLDVNASGVIGNDDNPDSVSVSAALVSSTSHGDLTFHADGSFEYVPDEDWSGSDSFTYRLTYGSSSETAAATVSITVHSVVDAPTAADDSNSVSEDGVLTVSAAGVLVNDSDPEGGSLSASVVTGPSHGSLTLNTDGSYVYTPDANFFGDDSFTYRASNISANSNTATVTITVTPVNDAPTGSDDEYNVYRNGSLNVGAPGVLGNDGDVDGDSLSVSGSGVSHGSLTLNANGSFEYTPSAGYVGDDGFTYTINDGTTSSGTVTVTIHVNNRAPTAANDGTYEGTEGSVLNGGGLLDNDGDADGDSISAEIVDDPTSGTLTLNSDGTFSYTPASGFTGNMTFTYRVSDGVGYSSPATVTMNIVASNLPPTAEDDEYEMDEDDTLEIDAPGVLDNDSDPNTGDSLTATLVGGPITGLTFNSDGSFTYTPAANTHGTFNFSYTVSDGTVTSDPATVTIVIGSVNDAPVAEDDIGGAEFGEAATIDVLDNDTDAEGETLTINDTTNGSHGTVTIVSGQLVYTPDALFAGEDTFTYKVSDGTLSSDWATVTVTIDEPVNWPPVATNDSFEGPSDADLLIDLLANDSDAEDDPLTVTILVAPAHGTLTENLDGTYTYTPDANLAGTDSFVYRISDGTSTDDATVSITLTQGNRAPVAHADIAWWLPGESSVSFSVLGNDTDADSDTLHVESVTDGAHGTVTIVDGNLVYTPADEDFFGTDTFSYTISDGLLESGSVTVTVIVNHAPVLSTAGNSHLLAIDEDATDSAGMLVSDLLASGGTQADSDADDDAVRGIAVVEADNAHGVWQYRLTSGGTWQNFGFPDREHARLLAADSQTRVRFVPDVNYHGTVGSGLSFLAWDRTLGGNGELWNIDATVVAASNDLAAPFSAATEMASITVTSVNDAPVNQVPAAQVVSVNSSMVFSTAGGNAVTVSDVDAGSQIIKTVISVDHGALQLATTSGLSSVTGNGTGTVTIYGTVSAINMALDGLLYTPFLGYRGDDALEVITNDLGNIGTGGAKSDTDSVVVYVRAPFSLEGTTLYLTGTTGDDFFVVNFNSGDGTIVVTVNGDSRSFLLSEIESILLSGSGGNDTLSVYGNEEEAELAILRPNELEFESGDITLNASVVSTIYVFGDADDVAEFYDSSGADNFYGTAHYAVLMGSGYLNEVIGIGESTAFSSNAGSIVDVAFLYDSTGDDIYEGRADLGYARLWGTGFSNKAVGFKNNYGYAYNGGNDVADIRGTSAAETFEGSPFMGRLIGGAYLNYISMFDTVEVTGGAGDTASIYSVVGDPSGPSNSVTISDSSVTWVLKSFDDVDDYEFILPGNTAPELHNNHAPQLNAIVAGELDNPGTTITGIIASAPGLITDDLASYQGLAIIATDDSHGVWQYTLAGDLAPELLLDDDIWTTLTASATSALLLPAESYARVRFVPEEDYYGTVSSGLTFRAWDRTSGTVAGRVDLDAPENVGGSTAFSAATDTAAITVFAGNTTPNVTSATTDEDEQSTSGLVITPSSQDAGRSSHFQVTGIHGGRLYKSNGTTEITDGSFITLAEGAAGLRFTPPANSSAGGSFTVQSSTSGSTAGLHGGTTNGTITVLSVNDTPTFEAGPDETVRQDVGRRVIYGWAENVTPGPLNEYSQSLTFEVSTPDDDFFAEQPAISSDGTLSYKPKNTANGTATITVQLLDSGGTENGGDDLSAAQTFTITIEDVNTTPTLEPIADPTAINELDSAAVQQVILEGLSGGALDEDQELTISISTSDEKIVPRSSVEVEYPLIDGEEEDFTRARVSYAPTPGGNGTAYLTVRIQDADGRENGSVDTITRVFRVGINAINDTPTLDSIDDQVIDEDDSEQTIPLEDVTAGYRTTAHVSGDTEDAHDGQTITVTAISDNENLTGPITATLVDGDWFLIYTPVPHRSGTAEVEVTVTDNLSASTTQSFQITVTDAVHAPVISTTGSALVYADHSGAVAIDPGITLTDQDSQITGAMVAISAHYVSTQDELLFSTQSGISGSFNDTTGLLTLSGTASPAAYQAALRSVQFLNAQDRPNVTNDREVTFTVTDDTPSGGATDSATRTVQVTRVNNTPTLASITNVTTSENQGSGASAAAREITLTGITDGGDNGQTLSFTSISSSNTSLVPTPTIDDIVDGEAVLSFTPVALHTGTVMISVTLTDDDSVANTGTALSITRTFVIQVSPFDYLPTLTAIDDPDVIGEGDGEQTIDLSGIGNGESGASGVTVWATSGDTSRIPTPSVTYTPGSTTAVVHYTPAADAFGEVEITIHVQDAAAQVTTRSFTVEIDPVADAPRVTTTGTSLGYTENQSATAIDSGLLVYDPDKTTTYASASQELTGVTVTISANYVAGQDVLQFTNQNGITGAFNSTSGVLTLAGAATQAHYQTALRSVAYVNTSEDPNTSTRTVSFVVDDGGLTSTVATRSITPTAVDDAPQMTGPSNQTIDEDSGEHELTLTGIATVESGQSITSIVATSNHPEWIAHPEIDYTSGSTATLTFEPAANFVGSVTITVTTTDSGGTSGGGQNTLIRTFTITVTNVNDAPVIDTGTGYTPLLNATLPETTSSEVLVSGLLASIPGVTFVSDIDPSAQSGIAVTGVDDTNGTWEYWVPSGSWSSFSTVDATTARLLPSTGKVRYTPNEGYTGFVNGLTFRAWDQTSGTSGDTADTTGSNSGGTKAFSATTMSAGIFVNSAPELDWTQTFTLDDINEDDTSNNGSLVSDIIASGGTDPAAVADPDSDPLGIAIIGASSSHGVWQYSLNNGSSWSNVGNVSGDVARVISTASGHRVRFVPAADYFGDATFSWQAWDQRYGAAGDLIPTQVLGLASSLSSVAATATITVDPVNDAPFLLTNSVHINEMYGDAVIYGLVSAGPENEAGQSVSSTFTVLNSGTTLWSGSPYVDSSGNFHFSAIEDVSGSASVSVTVNDGESTAVLTFTLNVDPVNDAPSFALADTSVEVDEDSGETSISSFVTGVTAGPYESEEVVISFATTNASLFATPPSISSGTLTFTPATNAFGHADVTVTATDAYGATYSLGFTIDVANVNDAPTFTIGTTNVQMFQSALEQTIGGIIDTISAGPGESESVWLSGGTFNGYGQLLFTPETPGTYTFDLFALDVEGLASANTESLTITVLPVIEELSATSVDEGTETTLTVTGGGGATLIVDWGDGSEAEEFSGDFHYVSHRYATDPTTIGDYYTINTKLVDEFGNESPTKTTTAAVTDVEPTFTSEPGGGFRVTDPGDEHWELRYEVTSEHGMAYILGGSGGMDYHVTEDGTYWIVWGYGGTAYACCNPEITSPAHLCEAVSVYAVLDDGEHEFWHLVDAYGPPLPSTPVATVGLSITYHADGTVTREATIGGGDMYGVGLSGDVLSISKDGVGVSIESIEVGESYDVVVQVTDHCGEVYEQDLHDVIAFENWLYDPEDGEAGRAVPDRYETNKQQREDTRSKVEISGNVKDNDENAGAYQVVFDPGYESLPGKLTTSPSGSFTFTYDDSSRTEPISFSYHLERKSNTFLDADGDGNDDPIPTAYESVNVVLVNCGCADDHDEQGNVSRTNGSTNTSPIGGGPGMTYNNASSSLAPIAIVNFELPEGFTDTFTAKLAFHGDSEYAKVNYDASGLDAEDRARIAIEAMYKVNRPTGLYHWSITLEAENPDEPESPLYAVYEGDQFIVNTRTSLLGDGWMFDDVDRLYPITGDDRVFFVTTGHQPRDFQWVSTDGVTSDRAYEPALDNDDGLRLQWIEDSSEYRLIESDDSYRSFDAEGRPLAEIDSSGHILRTFAYTTYESPWGDQILLSSITTESTGYQQTFLYDCDPDFPFGLQRVVAIVDNLGNTTGINYDWTMGHVVSITQPDPVGSGLAGWSSYEYDEDTSAMAAITDNSGNRTTYGVDETSGRATSIERRNEYQTTTETIAPLALWGRAIPGVDGVDSGDRASVVTHVRSESAESAWVSSVDTIERYDDDGNVTRSVALDPDGDGPLTRSMTKYEYDAHGNQSRVDYPDGTYEGWSYTTGSLLTTYRDRMGRYTYSAYDSIDRLILTRQAIDAIDSLISPVSSTNRPDALTLYTYVGLSDLQETVTQVRGLPDGPSGPESGDLADVTTRYQYDSRDNVTVTSQIIGVWDGLSVPGDPADLVTTRMYDAAGRVTQEQTPQGTTTIYRYDFRGNQTSVIQVAGVLDTLGSRPENDPDDIVTSYTYDSLGRQVSVTTADGTSYCRYNAAGNVVAQVEPDPDGDGPLGPRVTRYQYDADGNQTHVIDPLGRVTESVYNEGHLVTQYSPDPDGDGPLPRLATHYTYNDDGSQHTVTDPTGVVTTYDYYPSGQVKSVTLPDPDGDGPLGPRVTTYHYDIEGRQIRVTQPDPDGPLGPLPAPVTYTYYNPDGSISGVTDPRGTTSYQYDALGRQNYVIDALGNHTYTSYDQLGNVISQTDALGRVTTYEYDQANRLVNTTFPDPYSDDENPAPYTTTTESLLPEIDPDRVYGIYKVDQRDTMGRITTTIYNDLGQAVFVRRPDPDGVGELASPQMAMNYDASGRMVAQTQVRGVLDSLDDRPIDDPDDLITATEYDHRGLQTKVTLRDPDGEGPLHAPVTINTYDLVGTLIETRRVVGELDGPTGPEGDDPEDLITSYEYDQVGRNVAVHSPNPDAPGQLIASTAVYNAVGQVSRTTDIMGRATNYDYDSSGQLRSSTGPTGMTTYSYDNLGRMILTVEPDPDGSGSLAAPFTANTFNNKGDLIKVTTLAGVTQYAFNALGWQMSATDPAGGVVAYTYFADGAMKSLTDPVGNTREWTYDDLRRIKTDTNELDKIRTHIYDDAGNLIKKIDRNNRVIEYFYDNLNRRTAEKWMDDTTIVHQIDYVFNSDGQLESVSDPDSTYSYEYDGLGRIILLTQEIDGLPVVTLAQVFNAIGLRESVIVSVDGDEDFTNEYRWDARGQLRHITQTGPDVAEKRIDLDYDALGRSLTATRYSDVDATDLIFATSYGYDKNDRLASLLHESDTELVAGYTWEYDGLGRINTFSNALHPEESAAHTYDSTSQLIGTNRSGDESDESYSFDANGNRNADGHVVGPDNQLLSDGVFDYAYDDEGNRITKTEIATAIVTTFAWDYRNRLTGVTVTNAEDEILASESTKYDVLNRRIAHTTDTDGDGVQDATVEKFIYDDDDVVMDFSIAGASASVVRRYLHNPAIVDQVLAQEDLEESLESADRVHWQASDNQGTIRDHIDNEGNSALHLTYDSFGELLTDLPSNVQIRYTYTGREWSSISSTYYMRARWYDPISGNWISLDPIGLGAGDTNTSRFIFNSAPNATDPSGERAYLIPGAPAPGWWLGPIKVMLDATTDYKSELMTYGAGGRQQPWQATSLSDLLYSTVPDRWSTMTAVSTITEHIIRDLDNNKLEDCEPVVIVGHSMGGYIGAMVADRVGRHMIEELHYDRGVDALIMLGSRTNYAGFGKKTLEDVIIGFSNQTWLLNLLPEHLRVQMEAIRSTLNVASILDVVGLPRWAQGLERSVRNAIDRAVSPLDQLAEWTTIAALGTVRLPSDPRTMQVINIQSPNDVLYGGLFDIYSNVSGAGRQNIIIPGTPIWPFDVHKSWPLDSTALRTIHQYATQSSPRWSD